MAASLNSSFGANPRFNAARRTPPVTFAYGNLGTGDSPIKVNTLPSETDNKAPDVDPQILSELHGNLFSIKTDVFIRNFLYGEASDPDVTDEEAAQSVSNSGRRALDEELAKKCLEALVGQDKNEQFQQVVKHLNMDEGCEMAARISPYQGKQFTKLVKDIRAEKDLYQPLADLFSFINIFFRCYLNRGMTGEWSLEIDRSWPLPTDPKEPNEIHSTLLRRRFIVSYNQEYQYSPHVPERPILLPDLSLVLCKKLEAKWIETDLPHWKDVKVPIEVKLSDGFDANRVCQMARYARAIRLEQFDRNFAFSILISKNKCRVFHWAASRCHVTEVNIHENPAVFIQIIGRLASMDPQSMGYDPRFSNSGRVLSNETRKFPTRLEIVPARPTEYHEPSSGDGDEGREPLVLDLFIDRPMFQARGFLFSRFTRVWEGREVDPTTLESEHGELRVVKQNWADADRVNEAYLYEKAKDVPYVARLMGYETVTRTIDIRSLWHDGAILGVYRKGAEQALPQLDTVDGEKPFTLYTCKESPRAFSRALVRMVFQQKGRSILKAQSSRELLEAAKQWIVGIFGLNDAGIIHRDVSSGNLLLGYDSNSPAFLIDLGLAHFSPPNKEDSSTSESEGDRTAKAHHHLTGTLPFIAVNLLIAMRQKRSLQHEVQHDLESVFWVLLYVVLLAEESEDAKFALLGLLSTEPKEVESIKLRLLGGKLNPDSKAADRITLDGRYKDLAHFFGRFASICWARFDEGADIKLDDLIALIDRTISSLPPGSGERPKTKRKRGQEEGQKEGQEEVQGSGERPETSRRKRNPEEGQKEGQEEVQEEAQEEQVDGSSTGSSRIVQNMCSEQEVLSQDSA